MVFPFVLFAMANNFNQVFGGVKSWVSLQHLWHLCSLLCLFLIIMSHCWSVYNPSAPPVQVRVSAKEHALFEWCPSNNWEILLPMIFSSAWKGESMKVGDLNLHIKLQFICARWLQPTSRARIDASVASSVSALTEGEALERETFVWGALRREGEVCTCP